MLSTVEAVVFDAVGTVMFPEPSVAETYRQAIQRHCGVQIAPDVVSDVVRKALRQRSQTPDLSTSESAEYKFWANLIRQLCPGSPGFQACFEDLFQHFSSSENWRCFPEVAEVFQTLSGRGYRVAIASNFDRRLNSVCDGLPPLAAADHRVISSAVGWRKPDPRFFQAVAAELNVAADRILLVGDDRVNDVKGALAAGMKAAWICRHGIPDALPADVILLTTLRDLIENDPAATDRERERSSQTT
ncbi:MAG: HAD-IIIA family hydrolase [Fuerstiella sp.]